MSWVWRKTATGGPLGKVQVPIKPWACELISLRWHSTQEKENSDFKPHWLAVDYVLGMTLNCIRWAPWERCSTYSPGYVGLISLIGNSLRRRKTLVSNPHCDCGWTVPGLQVSRNPGLQPPRTAGPRFNVRLMATVDRTVKESSPILALCRRLYAPWVCGDYGWSSFASTHPWGSPHASRLPATAAWSLKHGGGVQYGLYLPLTLAWNLLLAIWPPMSGPGFLLVLAVAPVPQLIKDWLVRVVDK